MSPDETPKTSWLPVLAVGAFMLVNTGVLMISAPVLLLLLAEGAGSVDTHPENWAFVILCGSALLVWPLGVLASWVLLAFRRWGLSLILQVVAALLIGCGGLIGVVAAAVGSG